MGVEDCPAFSRPPGLPPREDACQIRVPAKSSVSAQLRLTQTKGERRKRTDWNAAPTKKKRIAIKGQGRR